MVVQSPVPDSAESQPQRQSHVFEFTKRKKWADILISELPDTVLLILDTDGQIQYVGPNTSDVLGWEVEDLSETDFLDIVNDDDKRAFNNHFQRSLTSQLDLSCYSRLKCKPARNPEQGTNQRELLFEIRGHALYLPEGNQCKCFFLVAKPYPSRNMAVLNTFLELKIENERLTQRLRDLKLQQDVIPGSINNFPLPISQSTLGHAPFATFEFPSSRDNGVQSPSTASTNGSLSTMQAGFLNSTVPNTNMRDEEGEEGGKKKKQKKGNGLVQQYVCVTCGRTDSPEWRKGPRGPKTLCNACGLRWAKRSKRTDDVPIPYVQGQSSREARDESHQRSSTATSSKGSSSTSRGARGMPVANAALSVTPVEPSTASSSSPSSGQSHHQRNQSESQQQGQGQSRNVPTHSPFHTALNPVQMQALPSNFPTHSLMNTSVQHHGAQQAAAASLGQGYVSATPAQFAEQHPTAYYGQHYWAMKQNGERLDYC